MTIVTLFVFNNRCIIPDCSAKGDLALLVCGFRQTCYDDRNDFSVTVVNCIAAGDVLTQIGDGTASTVSYGLLLCVAQNVTYTVARNSHKRTVRDSTFHAQHSWYGSSYGEEVKRLSSYIETMLSSGLKIRSHCARSAAIAARRAVSHDTRKVHNMHFVLSVLTQRDDGRKRCQSRKQFDFESVSVCRRAVSCGRRRAVNYIFPT